MFLDPLAAQTVLESSLDVTLIPLKARRKVTPAILGNLELSYKTPELIFAHQLLSLLHRLQKNLRQYGHMVIDGLQTFPVAMTKFSLQDA